MQDYDSSADKIRLVTVTTGWSLQHLTQEDVIAYLTIAFILYQFAITSPRAVKTVVYWVRVIKTRIAKYRARRSGQGG